MKPSAVTVIDLASGRLFAGNGGAEIKPGGAMGDYADYKRRHEMDWRQKISHVLSYIPDVLVTTNVELDPEVVNEQKSTEYGSANAVVFKSRSVTAKAADAPSARRRSETAERNDMHQPATLLSTAGLTKDDETSAIEQEKAVPTTEKFVVREGRTPTRVTVSVAVPNSYYEKIWRQQNPVSGRQPPARPDPAELAVLQETERKKIETAVLTLLPVPAVKTSDFYPQVTVSTFYQVLQPALPQATASDDALAWLGQYWSTLGMILLALVSLFMLRGMVKTVPAAAAAPPAGTTFERRGSPALVADSAEERSDENLARGPSRRRAAHGPQLRDELADIVRDDPDAAVSILRTWIGNAS
jgi:flagellar M-ring protein FliF